MSTSFTYLVNYSRPSGIYEAMSRGFKTNFHPCYIYIKSMRALSLSYRLHRRVIKIFSRSKHIVGTQTPNTDLKEDEDECSPYCLG
jgi:hypothetical protein